MVLCKMKAKERQQFEEEAAPRRDTPKRTASHGTAATTRSDQESSTSTATTSRRDGGQGSQSSLQGETIRSIRCNVWAGLALVAQHVRRHPTILFVGLLVFGALAATGVSLCNASFEAREHDVYNEAEHMADDAAESLARGIETSVLPLFTISQFATELPAFADLSARIGKAGEPGSLPLRPGLPFRNVTGVCDDPELVQRFTEIASTVVKNLPIDEGMLKSIFLAPQAVVCLATGPIDMRIMVGLDALEHPTYKELVTQAQAEAVVGPADLKIRGPMILKNICPTCGLHLQVSLPILFGDRQREIAGTTYWGFVSAFISWEEVVQQNRILERFEERGYEIHLTRKDRAYNPETDEIEENEVVLAHSEGFGSKQNTIVSSVTTVGDDWVMYIQFDHDSNKALYYSISVVVSFFIACLVYTILVQKQVQTALRGTSLAQKAKVDIERNMTACKCLRRSPRLAGYRPCAVLTVLTNSSSLHHRLCP